MSRWEAPTDPDTLVAVTRTESHRYHRPHWTGSGTHCVNWMQTRLLNLKEVTAPSPLRLVPCGRCYYR